MPTFDLIKPQFDISRIMARVGQPVALVRGSTTLTSQNFIVVEVSTSASAVMPTGPAGRGGEMMVVMIGYRNYTGQTDANIAIGDRWPNGGAVYEVVGINDTVPGRREAKMRVVR